LQYGKFDGIVGMGFEALSVGSVPTPMLNLMSQSLIQQGLFAFYLGDQVPGEITIGQSQSHAESQAVRGASRQGDMAALGLSA
jgi:hypothetical protein